MQIKIGLSRLKITPKQLESNSKITLKNFKKRLFLTKKLSKMAKNGQKLAFLRVKIGLFEGQIWREISIFESIYQPFVLKVDLKVGFLRPKTMPKPFWNNFKKTVKKSRKRFSWSQKWAKNGQNWHFTWAKIRSNMDYNKGLLKDSGRNFERKK